MAWRSVERTEAGCCRKTRAAETLLWRTSRGSFGLESSSITCKWWWSFDDHMKMTTWWFLVYTYAWEQSRCIRSWTQCFSLDCTNSHLAQSSPEYAMNDKSMPWNSSSSTHLILGSNFLFDPIKRKTVRSFFAVNHAVNHGVQCDQYRSHSRSTSIILSRDKITGVVFGLSYSASQFGYLVGHSASPLCKFAQHAVSNSFWHKYGFLSFTIMCITVRGICSWNLSHSTPNILVSLLWPTRWSLSTNDQISIIVLGKISEIGLENCSRYGPMDSAALSSHATDMMILSLHGCT